MQINIKPVERSSGLPVVLHGQLFALEATATESNVVTLSVGEFDLDAPLFPQAHTMIGGEIEEYLDSRSDNPVLADTLYVPTLHQHLGFIMLQLKRTVVADLVKDTGLVKPVAQRHSVIREYEQAHYNKEDGQFLMKEVPQIMMHDSMFLWTLDFIFSNSRYDHFVAVSNDRTIQVLKQCLEPSHKIWVVNNGNSLRNTLDELNEQHSLAQRRVVIGTKGMLLQGWRHTQPYAAISCTSLLNYNDAIQLAHRLTHAETKRCIYFRSTK